MEDVTKTAVKLSNLIDFWSTRNNKGNEIVQELRVLADFHGIPKDEIDFSRLIAEVRYSYNKMLEAIDDFVYFCREHDLDYNSFLPKAWRE